MRPSKITRYTVHLTSSNSCALTPISLTRALPLELLCQISCCNRMVSAKKKRAQRQKQYKDAAKVDMKEYYESPIKLSQNENYEQNKDAKKMAYESAV